MMPPVGPVTPPTGDVTPYPYQVLALGDNRWLTPDARILPSPFGEECDLQANTLAYWEAAALKATGKTLSELIV